MGSTPWPVCSEGELAGTISQLGNTFSPAQDSISSRMRPLVTATMPHWLFRWERLSKHPDLVILASRPGSGEWHHRLAHLCREPLAPFVLALEVRRGVAGAQPHGRSTQLQRGERPQVTVRSFRSKQFCWGGVSWGSGCSRLEIMAPQSLRRSRWPMPDCALQ
jgi:hypothetical protein